MKKILIWGDNPLGITGFGKVVRNVIDQIANPGYEIDVLGISFWGDRPDTVLGYKLISALQPGQQIDLFGHQKLYLLLATGGYDALFIVNDLTIVAKALPGISQVKERLSKKFKIIHYFPVDGPVWEGEVKDSISQIDYPVAYTKYGRDMVSFFDPKLSGIDVIYHGTDKDIFHPFKTEKEQVEARKSFWNKNSDKFIILNVNRNQPRKDLAKTFEVYSEFRKSCPESYLFLMSDPADIGGDLIKIAQSYGLEYGENWWSAPIGSQTRASGYTEDQIANLYRVSDVLITTTMGEGWGLSITEAMASGIPVVAPDNSACSEILADDRGWLTLCGGINCTTTLGLNDRNVVRPRVRTDSMVQHLISIHNGHAEPGYLQKANEWVPTWDKVGEQWRNVFGRALK